MPNTDQGMTDAAFQMMANALKRQEDMTLQYKDELEKYESDKDKEDLIKMRSYVDVLQKLVDQERDHNSELLKELQNCLLSKSLYASKVEGYLQQVEIAADADGKAVSQSTLVKKIHEKKDIFVNNKFLPTEQTEFNTSATGVGNNLAVVILNSELTSKCRFVDGLSFTTSIKDIHEIIIHHLNVTKILH